MNSISKKTLKLNTGKKSKKRVNESERRAKEYFEKNPDAWNEVKKATYAWNMPKYMSHDWQHKYVFAHGFTSNKRNNECIVCGRTREDVRYDNKDYRCEPRAKRVLSSPSIPEMKSIILEEENNYRRLLKRAQKDLPKWHDNLKDITGDRLAVLHHTHGYQPEIVQDVLGGEYSDEQIRRYGKSMKKHKQASK